VRRADLIVDGDLGDGGLDGAPSNCQSRIRVLSQRPFVASYRPLVDTVDFVSGMGSWGPVLSVVVGTVLGMSSAVETPAAAGQWWRVDDAELRTALTDMQNTIRRNYHAMLEMVREAD
jgi:hypothetical protein